MAEDMAEDSNASAELSNNNDIDEESGDSSSPDGTKPLRPRQIGDRRKVNESEFKYNCGWTACSFIASSMNEFNHHVSLHRRGYTRSLGPDNEIASAQFAFYCQWQGCNALIEGQIDDFNRHVFYHTFHQYLKFLGQHIQTVEKLNKCTLGTEACNIIPELPEKLMCRWKDCGIVYDNPYVFYSHASHHWEDYPKGNNPSVIIRCKWEGCTAVCKSGHKLRDHIRSHTQAKVVACPTCGSLFASNTRFIDHLIRQETDAKFECSHCHNRFCSERILREHVRQHINQYKCPMCDMTCHSPSSVRDHVRYRHSQEKGFPCPQCSYRGKSAGDVRRHSRSHLTREMFSCTKAECEMVFKKRTELLKHYTDVHEVVRQYECHICTKQFSRGTILTTHLKEIHSYRWPSGHRRFRYRLGEDGVKRLETVRYESFEVSQQILGQDVAGESTLPLRAVSTYNTPAADNCTDAESSTHSRDPPEAEKKCIKFNDPFTVCKDENVQTFKEDSVDTGTDPFNSHAASVEEHDTDGDPKNNEHDTDSVSKNNEHDTDSVPKNNEHDTDSVSKNNGNDTDNDLKNIGNDTDGDSINNEHDTDGDPKNNEHDTDGDSMNNEHDTDCDPKNNEHDTDCDPKINEHDTDCDPKNNEHDTNSVSENKGNYTDSDLKNKGPDTDSDPKNKCKLKVSQRNNAKSIGRCKNQAAESAMVNEFSADISSNSEVDRVAAKRQERKRKRADSPEKLLDSKKLA